MPMIYDTIGGGQNKTHLLFSKPFREVLWHVISPTDFYIVSITRSDMSVLYGNQSAFHTYGAHNDRLIGRMDIVCMFVCL